MRVVLALVSLLVTVFGQYTDVLTRNNVAPVEVINFAIESGAPDAVSSRSLAESRRSEAAHLATASLLQNGKAHRALKSLSAADEANKKFVEEFLSARA